MPEQERADPHQRAIPHLDRELAAGAAEGADAIHPLQIPRPGLVTVGTIHQGPHRADLDTVTTLIAVFQIIAKAGDLAVVAAFDRAQNVRPDDLVTHAHTTHTLDTTVGIEDDHIIEGHIPVIEDTLLLDEDPHPRAMVHHLILQFAFTRLVTNRAIERMRCEQELDGSSLTIACLICLCEDDHAIFHFIRTGGFQLGQELDLRRAVLHHDLTRRAVTHRTADLHKALGPFQRQLRRAARRFSSR